MPRPSTLESKCRHRDGYPRQSKPAMQNGRAGRRAFARRRRARLQRHEHVGATGGIAGSIECSRPPRDACPAARLLRWRSPTVPDDHRAHPWVRARGAANHKGGFQRMPPSARRGASLSAGFAGLPGRATSEPGQRALSGVPTEWTASSPQVGTRPSAQAQLAGRSSASTVPAKRISRSTPLNRPCRRAGPPQSRRGCETPQRGRPAGRLPAFSGARPAPLAAR